MTKELQNFWVKLHLPLFLSSSTSSFSDISCKCFVTCVSSVLYSLVELYILYALWAGYEVVTDWSIQLANLIQSQWDIFKRNIFIFIIWKRLPLLPRPLVLLNLTHNLYYWATLSEFCKANWIVLYALVSMVTAKFLMLTCELTTAAYFCFLTNYSLFLRPKSK